MGLFATRSPHRPCPIGLTVAKVESVQGNNILLSGVDLVDGTHVLDVKPYLPYCDSIEGATVPHWVKAFELERYLIELEVFERVHKQNKGKGDWCDEKAKKVGTTYQHIVNEKNVSEMEMDNDEIAVDAEPPTELSFDSEAWTNAIGVPKKKNAYGHSQASSSLSKDPIIYTPTILVIREEDVIQLKEDKARLQGVVETCMRRMEEIQNQLDSQKNTAAASE